MINMELINTIKYLEGIGDIKLFWIEEPFVENAWPIIRSW